MSRILHRQQSICLNRLASAPAGLSSLSKANVDCIGLKFYGSHSTFLAEYLLANVNSTVLSLLLVFVSMELRHSHG